MYYLIDDILMIYLLEILHLDNLFEIRCILKLA